MAHESPAAADSRPSTNVGRVVRELPSARAQAVRVSKRQTTAFWSELVRGQDNAAAGRTAASSQKVQRQWRPGIRINQSPADASFALPRAQVAKRRRGAKASSRGR
jgi:hypothetical protein